MRPKENIKRDWMKDKNEEKEKKTERWSKNFTTNTTRATDSRIVADVHSTSPYSEDNMELRQLLCSMPILVYNSVKICKTMNHRDKLLQSIWFSSSYIRRFVTFKHIHSENGLETLSLSLIWKHMKTNGKRYKPHLYVKQSLRYNPWCQHAISAFLKGFRLTIERADHCVVVATIGAVHPSTTPISMRGKKRREKNKN